MDKQEARKVVFDVLNRELIKPGQGSDTLAHAIVEAIMPDQMTITLNNSAGVFTPEPKRHNLLGFMPIGEMSRAELIDECVAYHRRMCEQVSDNELKTAIVNSRLAQFQQRLIKEAKLDPPMGLFGWPPSTSGEPSSDD